jgi:hypothetical protein
MKTFFEFKDYLTPGRERILQAADIHGSKLKKSQDSKEWVKGNVKKERALAILNRGVEPTPENKEKAEFWRKQSKFWK